MVNVIENHKSEIIKSVLKLKQKDNRNELGLFLLEGPQSIKELLAYRPHLLKELYVTPTAWQKYSSIFQSPEDIDYSYVNEKIMQMISDTVSPQGIVAVCKQSPYALKKVYSKDTKMVVVLNEVRDPGNLGTMIRIADAAGVDAVILSGRHVDLYNSKVLRSSTGSIFHIPICVNANFDEVIQLAKQNNSNIIAADVKGEDLSVDIRKKLISSTTWVFGNEAKGISDEHLNLCDQIVKLPIYGKAESLNVATAASVLIYETAFMQKNNY